MSAFAVDAEAALALSEFFGLFCDVGFGVGSISWSLRLPSGLVFLCPRVFFNFFCGFCLVFAFVFFSMSAFAVDAEAALAFSELFSRCCSLAKQCSSKSCSRSALRCRVRLAAIVLDFYPWGARGVRAPRGKSKKLKEKKLGVKGWCAGVVLESKHGALEPLSRCHDPNADAAPCSTNMHLTFLYPSHH